MGNLAKERKKEYDRRYWQKRKEKNYFISEVGKLYAIYLLTFPNGKHYVGQTKNFYNRMKSHKSFARTKKKYLIEKAIDKYGWNNITKEILVIVEEKYSDFFEKAFIAGYKSNDRNYGYNLNSGGHLTKKISEATKLLWSKQRKGKKINHSPETREKYRRVAETMREKLFKPIIAFNKITGEYVDSFINVREASKKLNVNYSHIGECAGGKRKSAGGYIWAFPERRVA